MSRQLAPAGANQADAGNAGEPQQQQQAQESLPITEEEVYGYREQDRFLPINNIQRLMKRSLPDSSKISKDAKECIQEATSELISFITSEAADRATSEKRKTITGDDILNALKTLGFDEMSEVLLIYLAKYRELQSKEPARKRPRKASGTTGKPVASDANGASTSGTAGQGINGTAGTAGKDGQDGEDDDEGDEEDDDEDDEENKLDDHDDTFDMLDLPSDNE